jgi:ClpP class serine protease
VQIARALKSHPGKVTVFVPHYAMSGGTLIALAADEIVMSPHAVLGPVDPQIAGMPAASILSVLEKKDAQRVGDETLMLADLSQKAMAQLDQIVLELVSGRLPPVVARQLAETLVTGIWTHDYPVTAEQAKALGLAVSERMPLEILELMAFYPQPVRTQPSVDYLPYRERPTGSLGGGVDLD